MNTSFEAPYYNFKKSEKVKTITFYNQFINWVIGEFDLYQIDESEVLKIYFSNGWFTIEALNKNENCIKITIKIKSKTLNDGRKIENKINSIFSNLYKIYKN